MNVRSSNAARADLRPAEPNHVRRSASPADAAPADGRGPGVPRPPSVLPDLDTFLAALRGRRFYFAPVSGNNGDRLIEMGSRRLLADHGLSAVAKPRGADLLVINGGFAMSDLWPHGFDQCRRLSNRYPTVPLLVLPSSFWIDRTDFPALFTRRLAPLHLYCREPGSAQVLRRLRFPCATGVGLDHDTALALARSPWLAGLAGLADRPARGGHVLIVPRFDGENAMVAPVAHRRRLPAWVRDRLWPLAPLRDAANRWLGDAMPGRRRRPRAVDPLGLPFVQQALAHHRSTAGADGRTPVRVADISDPAQATFAEFCDAIAGASAVYTERLHVGILAGLLGKPTYLRAGNTHKIRGIYDHSLRGFPSVRMLESGAVADVDPPAPRGEGGGSRTLASATA